MTVDIEQLKAALRDVLAEQDKLRQRLATMRQQLAALQALSRELQADALPDATPYFVRLTDGRTYYGQTLEEAGRLAAEGEYRDLQADTPPDAAPWQGHDGWEGRTP